jgi:putative lipase involved disintegration of autophagic bodies
MNNFEYLVSIPCPLGGPDVQYHGECQAQFRGYDFDGYLPTTIYRDGCEMTYHSIGEKAWSAFVYRLGREIKENNIRHKVSKIIDAACKGTAAPVVISFDGGHESNARMIEIEALSEEM